jgi:hypothetical protein
MKSKTAGLFAMIDLARIRYRGYRARLLTIKSIKLTRRREKAISSAATLSISAVLHARARKRERERERGGRVYVDMPN